MIAVLIELTDTIVKKVLPSVTKAVRIEISILVSKVLLGVVICSTLIFSIFQTAVYYVAWLEPTQGEGLYLLISFALVILLCLTGLYFLFKTDDKETPPVTIDKSSSLFLIFGQGFLHGFHSKRDDYDRK